MKINPFLLLYQYLIVLPVVLVLTIITALLTIIMSPFAPNSRVTNFPARWWSRLICYLFFIRVKVSGLEKSDPAKSYVFVSNHQSLFDIFVLYGWLPNLFKWIMKMELKKIPLVGQACESVGHIFIDRSNPMAAQKSLEKAESRLVKGVSVVVFPEGTRTKTGKMSQFKRGAFRIATDLGLPLLPITIKGSFERLHPGKLFYVRPGTIEVILHDSIDVKSYGNEVNPELIRHTWEVINGGME
ncbi:MAG TPA: lysophospholipid acyltransferase family protein [Paludibacter sp.]|nr:lysophospholipid acyltransferase family protein [Paludibacter sp.]HOS46155.1 lysophospholipid acyltransferase family protein [Paludibacter sp.]